MSCLAVRFSDFSCFRIGFLVCLLNIRDLLCERLPINDNIFSTIDSNTYGKPIKQNQNPDRLQFEDLQFDVVVQNDENEPVFGFDQYYRTTEIYQLMDYLHSKHKDLVEIIAIGQTWEKRPIRTMKISSKNANNSAIWIDGGIHAREWISVSSVCFIMYSLLKNWRNLDPVFRNVDYYLTPVLNPDGYEFSHGKYNRMWRKNRRRTDFCFGVDLNRNFPYKWGTDHYTSRNFGNKKCGEEFAGPAPLSEPETRAVTNFILQFSNKFKGFLSFHTYGQSILYPYGYEPRVPKDALRFEYVGKQASAKIQEVTGFEYEVTTGSMLSYSFPGNSMDWAYKVASIPYSYLVELRNTSSFVLPPSNIIPAGKEALIIAMTLVDNFDRNINTSYTRPDDLFDEVIVEDQ